MAFTGNLTTPTELVEVTSGQAAALDFQRDFLARVPLTGPPEADVYSQVPE